MKNTDISVPIVVLTLLSLMVSASAASCPDEKTFQMMLKAGLRCYYEKGDSCAMKAIDLQEMIRFYFTNTNIENADCSGLVGALVTKSSQALGNADYAKVLGSDKVSDDNKHCQDCLILPCGSSSSDGVQTCQCIGANMDGTYAHCLLVGQGIFSCDHQCQFPSCLCYASACPPANGRIISQGDTCGSGSSTPGTCPAASCYGSNLLTCQWTTTGCQCTGSPCGANGCNAAANPNQCFGSSETPSSCQLSDCNAYCTCEECTCPPGCPSSTFFNIFKDQNCNSGSRPNPNNPNLPSQCPFPTCNCYSGPTCPAGRDPRTDNGYCSSVNPQNTMCCCGQSNAQTCDDGTPVGSCSTKTAGNVCKLVGGKPFLVQDSITCPTNLPIGSCTCTQDCVSSNQPGACGTMGGRRACQAGKCYCYTGSQNPYPSEDVDCGGIGPVGSKCVAAGGTCTVKQLSTVVPTCGSDKVEDASKTCDTKNTVCCMPKSSEVGNCPDVCGNGQCYTNIPTNLQSDEDAPTGACCCQQDCNVQCAGGGNVGQNNTCTDELKVADQMHVEEPARLKTCMPLKVSNLCTLCYNSVWGKYFGSKDASIALTQSCQPKCGNFGTIYPESGSTSLTGVDQACMADATFTTPGLKEGASTTCTVTATPTGGFQVQKLTPASKTVTVNARILEFAPKSPEMIEVKCKDEDTAKKDPGPVDAKDDSKGKKPYLVNSCDKIKFKSCVKETPVEGDISIVEPIKITLTLSKGTPTTLTCTVPTGEDSTGCCEMPEYTAPEVAGDKDTVTIDAKAESDCGCYQTLDLKAVGTFDVIGFKTTATWKTSPPATIKGGATAPFSVCYVKTNPGECKKGFKDATVTLDGDLTGQCTINDLDNGCCDGTLTAPTVTANKGYSVTATATKPKCYPDAKTAAKTGTITKS